MRVLFWSSGFWPDIGGVEILAARLLPALQQRGHELLVVTPQKRPGVPGEERYAGVTVLRLPFFEVLRQHDPGAVGALGRRVSAIKREFAPDVVHINALGADSFFHLLTAAAHPCPVLVTLHGEWPQLGARADSVAEKILRSAALVVGCSRAILERGIALVPEIAGRCRVIHNGIELPGVAPAPLPWEPPHLLCLGRLVRDKGFDLALEAFGALRRRRPRLAMTIAGGGPERAALEEQALRLGIDDAVELCGWTDPGAVPQLLNRATALLLPSRRESLPVAALEAMAMSRPVIGADVGGLPEVVEHGHTGLLVPPENPGALADAVATLLQDAQRTAQMGAAGRRRVLESFTWSAYVDAYDAAHREVVLGAPPAGPPPGTAGRPAAAARAEDSPIPAPPPLTSALSVALPTAEESLFLRACLHHGERGRQAWEEWRRRVGEPLEVMRNSAWPCRGLLPLLGHALGRSGAGVDRGVQPYLRAAYVSEELRARTYYRVARGVVAALADAGIAPLLLKGLALADTVYGDRALRHSHDVDLLLPRAAIDPAVDLLVARKFRVLHRQRQEGHEHAVLAHESGLPVALHGRLFRSSFYTPPAAAMLADARAFDVDGAPARVLSPADNLLHVCGQAWCSPSRDSLQWACDAWLLIAGAPQLRWEVLLERARQARLSLPLFVLLDYLAATLDAAVPHPIRDRLSHQAAAADRVERQAALYGARRAPRGTLRQILRRSDSWRGRLQVLGWIIAPAPAHLLGEGDPWWALPGRYLRRPLRYAARRL